jgi:hypothetical protein
VASAVNNCSQTPISKNRNLDPKVQKAQQKERDARRCGGFAGEIKYLPDARTKSISVKVLQFPELIHVLSKEC